MIQRKRFETTFLLSISNPGNPAFLRKRLDEPLDGQRFVDTVLKGLVTEDGYQLKVNRDRTEVVVEGDAEITKIEFHGAILPDSINFEHLIELFGNGWECLDFKAATEMYDWIPRAIEEAERVGIEQARVLWERNGGSFDTKVDVPPGENGGAETGTGPRESQRMLFEFPDASSSSPENEPGHAASKANG